MQWNLRCRAKYQKKAPVLDEFIAGWATVLRRWRSERDMSCARADLHRFLGILDSWFDNPLMPKNFQSKPKLPTNAQPPQQQDKLALKEAEWGGYKDAAVRRLASLEEDGWTVAYTDGSSKMVRGWRQGGYGVWFAEASTRNFAAPIPESEWQSVSRGELRGVLHAILQQEGRQMHPNNQQGLPKRPRVEPMWADLGLEEMPSEMSSSGVSSNELSELEGGWGSEMDATSCSSEDTESTSGGSVSDTGSSQGGQSAVRK